MTFWSIGSHRNVFSFFLPLLLLTLGACNNGGGGGGDPSAICGSGRSTLPNIQLERVFPLLSFSGPVAMLQPPGDDTRWFVVQRGGTVVVFPNTNDAINDDKSTYVSVAVNTSGEGGLLGMAFHPNFPTTPYVYLSYTRTGPNGSNPLTTVVSRFESLDGGLSIDQDSEIDIFTINQPATNHNGGHIAFGPGGLYIGLGDGGGGNDPGNNGQNINTVLGAMLRIDVDGGTPYSIPADNPFAGGGGAPEIFAWGLRNPWRWSFDRSDQRLWLGDVGQSTWEEIDIVELGKNYGWNVCEGSYRRGSSSTICATPALSDPIAEYPNASGCSVTGGYVYRGSAVPSLYGTYLFGDFCAGIICGLKENTGAPPTVEQLIDSGLSVVSFAEGADGELYVVNIGGTLHKVVASP